MYAHMHACVMVRMHACCALFCYLMCSSLLLHMVANGI